MICIVGTGSLFSLGLKALLLPYIPSDVAAYPHGGCITLVAIICRRAKSEGWRSMHSRPARAGKLFQSSWPKCVKKVQQLIRRSVTS
jgi:hypothetical protein